MSMPGLPELLVILMLLLMVVFIVLVIRIIIGTLNVSKKVIWILCSIAVVLVVLQVIYKAMEYWLNKP